MLLAQKAFSNYDCYHLLEPYLTGTEASGLYEARLGAQEMPGKRYMYFAPDIVRMNLRSCLALQII